MKAADYEQFQRPLIVEQVPDPGLSPTGVVLEVKACGICAATGMAGWATTRISGCLTYPGMSWLGRSLLWDLRSQISTLTTGSRCRLSPAADGAPRACLEINRSVT